MKHLITISFILISNILLGQGLTQIDQPKSSNPDSGSKHVNISYNPMTQIVTIDNQGTNIIIAVIININTGEYYLLTSNTDMNGEHNFDISHLKLGIFEIIVVYDDSSNQYKRKTLGIGTSSY